MRILLGLLLIASTSTFMSGCGGPQEVAKKPDPVAEFSAMAPRLIPELNQVYKERNTNDALVKYLGLVQESAKIDVKKTDSMISPYTGIIVTECSFETIGISGFGEFTLNFAFQDGKWAPTGGVLTKGTTTVGSNCSGLIRIDSGPMQLAMDRIK